MTLRRLLLVVAFAAPLLAVTTTEATAHPLGNFTTNRFSALEISEDGITIHYVVDMAEVATRQELEAEGIDPQKASPDELDAYARREALLIASGVSLIVDGQMLSPKIRSSSATLSDGQAGLKVLRFEADLIADLPSPEATIEYTDPNYASRIGWKEVIAYTTGRQGIEESSVPETSISDALRSYPKDLLSSPPDVNYASVDVSPGATGSGAPVAERPEGAGSDWVGSWFSSLIERDVSPGYLLVALLVALGAGALHALQPGHGKTILAAYLVGSEGKVRHALALGSAVSLMHTASVVALGLITLWASSLFPPEDVYPWLSLVSGVVVLGLGTWLLAQRLTSRSGSHGHGQVQGASDTDADHEHGRRGAAGDHLLDHGGRSRGGQLASHAHDLPPDISPFTVRGMIAVGLSGGLLPSPAALIVLLGAVALQRIAFGIVLVAAFSIGLAGALTVVGLIVIKARGLAVRRLGGRTSSVLPVASAAAITLFGLILTARAAIGL